MELVNQRVKKIMEGCKERARDAGLRFDKESLEYIVTNRDLIELTPKLMIPTLYDYWVHDVEVLKEKGRYELYPYNPYETVINTRPAISFYNDNNPDWMNVMIFYHVIAHIDFFQNNIYFRNTWDYDFAGQALADKRLIARLRSEKGRWVDYVIEFARGIDNVVAYAGQLAKYDRPETPPSVVDYYFDIYLQSVRGVSTGDYLKELDRYNSCAAAFGENADQVFFTEVHAKYPEFKTCLSRQTGRKACDNGDLLQFLLDHSEFLRKPENVWMKSVLELVRNTSLFFQPQIRTKIMNEGWASFWHERLFLSDDRIVGHETDFARAHALIAALPRIGINPYALGMRLFRYIEELGDAGKHSLDFMKLDLEHDRKKFDVHAKKGKELIFEVRRNLSDYFFIDYFTDQDFVNRHDLFVTGKRMNRDRMVWEYYIKSRKAGDYREMLQESLYHPPHIKVDKSKTTGSVLYLVHAFEGKPLVNEYISNTMIGIEFLWGGTVFLETNEAVPVSSSIRHRTSENGDPPQVKWRRMLYTMKDRKLIKKEL